MPQQAQSDTQQIEVGGRVFNVPANWGDFQVKVWVKQGMPRTNYTQEVIDAKQIAADTGASPEQAAERARNIAKSTEKLIESRKPTPLSNVRDAVYGTTPKGLLETAEDISYPAMGATVGGVAGTPLGPGGIAFGGLLGGMAGEAAKQIVRKVRGSENVPQSSTEASKQIQMAGLGGGLQEASGVIAKANQVRQGLLGKNYTENAALAEGVPITKGQAGSRANSLAESAAEKYFTSQPVMQELKLQKQLPALNKSVNRLLEQISPVKLDQTASGEFVDAALQSARSRAGSLMGEVENKIAKELPNLKVSQAGAISKTARDLAYRISKATTQHPEVRKMAGQDINKALKLLRNFSDKSVEIPVQDAIELRSLLFKIGQSDEIATVGKGAIRDLTKAMHDAIGESLSNAGRADLFNEFTSASSNFRDVVSKLDTASIQRIHRLAKDSPENVADVFLGPSSASVSRRVASILTPDQSKAVFRAAIEKMFENSKNEDVLISQSFARLKDKVGPDALKTMLGNQQNVDRFERISHLIDKIGLANELTKPNTSGAGIAMTGGIAAGALSRFSPEAGGLLAAATAGPNLLARYLTRSGNLVTFENLLQKAARTGDKREVLAKITGIMLAESAKKTGKDVKGLLYENVDSTGLKDKKK